MSIGGANQGAGIGLAQPLVSPDQGWSWEAYKATGSVYVWGRQENEATSNTSIAATTVAPNGPDILRCVPHVFPRNGIIGQIGWFNGLVNGGGPQFRFGIYGCNAGFLTPSGPPLFDSGAQTTWPDPAGSPEDQWRKVTANLPVRANTLLYLVWFYNDAFRAGSQSIWCYATNSTGSPLGHLNPNVQQSDGAYRPAGSQYTQSKIIGYKHAQAFGAMPTTFPSATLVPLVVSGTYDVSVFGTNIPTFAFNWTNT